MYESPIEKIYGDIQSQIIKQDEEHLMYTVDQAIGYDIDKEELLKALQYDREQYNKGYGDCKADMLAKIKQARDEIQQLRGCSCSCSDGIIDDVEYILDKLIESEE